MKQINFFFITSVFITSAIAFSAVGNRSNAQEPASIDELADAGFLIKATPPPPAPGSPPAVAGAYGANRMLYTPPGTRRLSGDFYLPEEQSLGTDEFYRAPTYNYGGPTFPNELIVLDAGKNTAKNKPTFYFGAEGTNNKSDIGFQYEGLVNNGLPPGWAAVASVTLFTYKSRNPAQKETVGNWYQSTDPSNRLPQTPKVLVPLSVSIGASGAFFIDAGSLPYPSKVITRDGVPNLYTPRLYPEHIYSTVETSMKTDDIVFRRVIGMTQATGEVGTATGAFVHNLAFSNGKRWAWNSEVPQNWTIGTHEYQPPGDNTGYTKKIDNVEYPLFMADSLPPWHRFPDGTIREIPAVAAGGVAPPSRFFQESVNIDLLAPPGQIMAGKALIGTRTKKP